MDQDYNIYDGGHIPKDCKDIGKVQYSYNAAVFLQGAAFMYNYVSLPLLRALYHQYLTARQTDGSSLWKGRLDGLIKRTIELFFATGPATEISCELEDHLSCSTDMLSFKGYLHRWMAQAVRLAPYTHDTIMPVLKNSTAAAVKTCTGGANGRQCGFRWNTGGFDGVMGAGQQMSVLAALSTVLLDQDVV